ncbi:MAG: response regulator transcription factor [candidate division Zixibacteria bacterium]|nr:response regulator transcription factor [candidate division Zixibacteria bacterium]
MATGRILLLEDDTNLGLILQEHLQLNGFDVTLCVDGEQGSATFAPGKFDLCLVDVMMPKRDGFSFAGDVRSRDNDIPLIFLTAKSMKEDRIQGFKIGCDDYITKPFSMEELMLRIRAVLKRCQGAGSAAAPDVFTIGEYHFDHNRQTLKRGTSQISLTPKEADLLRLLCLHVNQTLTREEALREVWESESYFSGRSMDVYISKLRKYLKDDPQVEIMGIHGKGFRLIVG